MKKNDIVLIIVVASVSGIFALIVSNALIAGPKAKSEKVEVVEPIVADFPEPSKKYFNDQSIDPTQLIRIGDNTNPAPFSAN